MHTFVLPCKFNFAVYDSVRAINEHYPDDSEIIVVDSDSEDKQYMKFLREEDVIVEDIKNYHYITGAIWHAYKTFKRERYYFLHDSMILKGRLDEFVEPSVVSIRYFNSGNRLRNWIPNDPRGALGFGFDDEYSRHWSISQLEDHTSYELPDLFTGLFGSALICNRDVLEKLDASGFSKILPTQKIEDQSMERLWGVALHNEGYDIKTNTVCGNHNDNPSSELIEKKFYVRR